MNLKTVVSMNLNKWWIKVLIITTFSLILVISAFNPYIMKPVEENSSLKGFVDHLDKRVSSLMKYYNIPGINIALINSGETTWTKAYGYADLENGRKMTTDTYCRVQSISKSVTAWGVMKLVEQGKINLDKPVKQYIKNWVFPESKFSNQSITVRQLLSHNAGLPLGIIGPQACYSPEEDIPSLEDSLSKVAILKQEPGLSFSYSNVGFNLLELLIEEVTERDFAEYMKTEILIPLGMNSSFIWSKELEPAIPVGYDLKGNPVPVYVYPDKASGGLLASVEDIATFVTAEMTGFNSNHQVLNTQNINELHTPVVKIPGIYGLVFDSYGLGHFIETLPNGTKAISHGGQGYGIMTHYLFVPETGNGIVILTNSQRSWPLIAYVLNDWATWSGIDEVGMSKIILAKNVLWIFIGLIVFVLLWQLWRLVQGLITGRRHFAPLSKVSQKLRLIQGSLFIIISLGLLWAINQDYLFITAVFPIASRWLIILTFLFAVISLLFALFPHIEHRKFLVN